LYVKGLVRAEMRAKRQSTAAATQQSHDDVAARVARGPDPRGGDWRRHLPPDLRRDWRAERGGISEEDDLTVAAEAAGAPESPAKRCKRVPSLGTPRKGRSVKGRQGASRINNFGEWAVKSVSHKVLENERTLQKLREVGDEPRGGGGSVHGHSVRGGGGEGGGEATSATTFFSTPHAAMNQHM